MGTSEQMCAELAHVMSEVNQMLNAPGIGESMAYLLAHDISMPRFLVMRMLVRNDGMPISHVATQLKLTPGSASQLIDRLELDGFVARRDDDDDRRIKRIYLLDKGRNVVEAVKSISQKSLQHQLAQLPSPTITALLALFSETRTQLRKESQ